MGEYFSGKAPMVGPERMPLGAVDLGGWGKALLTFAMLAGAGYVGFIIGRDYGYEAAQY
jgi:hypothetical protein